MKDLFPTAMLWHSYLFMGIAGAFASVWPLPAIVAGLLIVLCDRRLHELARLMASLAIFILAWLPASWQISQIEQDLDAAPAWLGSNTRLCGKILAVQGFPDQRLRIILSDVHPAENSENVALPGYVRWTLRKPPENFSAIPGQQACLTRPVSQRHSFLNAEEGGETLLFAKKEYWQIFSRENAGNPVITGEGNFFARLREGIRSAFLKAARLSESENRNDTLPQSKAILVALLFGDRSFLSGSSIQDFVDSSLAHSLALSGQHLCMAALAAICLVQILGWLYPRLYLAGSRLFWISLLSLPFAVFYLWLGNAPASLVRAISMFFILALFVVRKKAWKGIDLVCAALLLALCASPMVIFDTGMQLSAACVLVIVLLGPYIPALPHLKIFYGHVWSKTALERIWQIFCVSLLIQIFLLPLVLLHFSKTSFLFPLNIIWLPVLGCFILPCAFLALGFCGPLPEFAAMLINLAAAPCGWLLEFLDFLRSEDLMKPLSLVLPHWSVLLAFAMLLCALALFMAKGSRRAMPVFALFALLFLAIGPALRLWKCFDAQPSISAIDVGQGQALLLEFEGGGRILIDGGGSQSKDFDVGKIALVPAVSKNFPPMLDAIVNSHPDLDHVGGLLTVADGFKIGQLFHNGNDLESQLKWKWREAIKRQDSHVLVAGDVIYLGRKENDLKLEVLYPPASGLRDSLGNRIVPPGLVGNDASLILRLSWQGRGLAIIPGDAPAKILDALARSDQDLEAQIIFAPHHGSDKSLAPSFYRRVRPEVVIASCGFQNRWNFPGRKLRNFLEEKEIPLLTTATRGKITGSFGRDGKITIDSVRPDSD